MPLEADKTGVDSAFTTTTTTPAAAKRRKQAKKKAKVVAASGIYEAHCMVVRAWIYDDEVDKCKPPRYGGPEYIEYTENSNPLLAEERWLVKSEGCFSLEEPCTSDSQAALPTIVEVERFRRTKPLTAHNLLKEHVVVTGPRFISKNWVSFSDEAIQSMVLKEIPRAFLKTKEVDHRFQKFPSNSILKAVFFECLNEKTNVTSMIVLITPICQQMVLPTNGVSRLISSAPVPNLKTTPFMYSPVHLTIPITTTPKIDSASVIDNVDEGSCVPKSSPTLIDALENSIVELALNATDGDAFGSSFGPAVAVGTYDNVALGATDGAVRLEDGTSVGPVVGPAVGATDGDAVRPILGFASPPTVIKSTSRLLSSKDEEPCHNADPATDKKELDNSAAIKDIFAQLLELKNSHMDLENSNMDLLEDRKISNSAIERLESSNMDLLEDRKISNSAIERLESSNKDLVKNRKLLNTAIERLERSNTDLKNAKYEASSQIVSLTEKVDLLENRIFCMPFNEPLQVLRLMVMSAAGADYKSQTWQQFAHRRGVQRIENVVLQMGFPNNVWRTLVRYSHDFNNLKHSLRKDPKKALMELMCQSQREESCVEALGFLCLPTLSCRKAFVRAKKAKQLIQRLQRQYNVNQATLVSTTAGNEPRWQLPNYLTQSHLMVLTSFVEVNWAEYLDPTMYGSTGRI